MQSNLPNHTKLTYPLGQPVRRVVQQVDHVICCTGLRSKIGFLPANILEQYEYEESDSVQPILLHALTWNPCVPSLAFVGVYRAPYFGMVELQAR